MQVRVNLVPANSSLIPSPERCLSIIHTLLPALAFEKYNGVVAQVHRYTRGLRGDLTSVQEFIAFLESLQHIALSYDELQLEAEGVREMYRLLVAKDINIPAMQYAAYQTMSADFQSLKEALDYADQRKDKLMGTFELEIAHEAAEISAQVRELQVDAQAEIIFDERHVSADPLERLKDEDRRVRHVRQASTVQDSIGSAEASSSNLKTPQRKGTKAQAGRGKAASKQPTRKGKGGGRKKSAVDLQALETAGDGKGAAQGEDDDDEEEDGAAAAGAPLVQQQKPAPDVVLSFMAGLQERLESLQSRAETIRRYQRTFDLEQSAFVELTLLAEEIELKRYIWQSLLEVDELVVQHIDVPISELHAEELHGRVTRLAKLVMRIERGLPPNKILPFLTKRVQVWTDIMPMILHLRNPDLRPRHWLKVEEIFGRKVLGEKSFTIRELLNALGGKRAQVRDVVLTTSIEATQEAQLEGMLKRVQDRWSRLELFVKPYKDLRDAYILGSTEHITECLEDSVMTMMVVQGSKYVAGIRTEVDRVDRSLRLFSETLDAWLECQRQWIYLETIFTAQDIQRQMPAETKSFFTVDRQFRDIMRKTRDRNNALQARGLQGKAPREANSHPRRRPSFPLHHFFL